MREPTRKQKLKRHLKRLNADLDTIGEISNKLSELEEDMDDLWMEFNLRAVACERKLEREDT